MSFHSGFVCILGRPNAGKSTLLNSLVGEKLAIISPKPQTTRNRIQGIVHLPKQKNKTRGQVILIDPPGVYKPVSSLDRHLRTPVQVARDAHEPPPVPPGNQPPASTKASWDYTHAVRAK